MSKYLPYPFGSLSSPQFRGGKIVFWHRMLAIFLYGQICIFLYVDIDQDAMIDLQILYFCFVSLFFLHLGYLSFNKYSYIWLLSVAFSFSMGIFYSSYCMESIIIFIMHDDWFLEPIALAGIINFLACFISYIYVIYLDKYTKHERKDDLDTAM